jgi:hypothetical protein
MFGVLFNVPCKGWDCELVQTENGIVKRIVKRIYKEAEVDTTAEKDTKAEKDTTDEVNVFCRDCEKTVVHPSRCAVTRGRCDLCTKVKNLEYRARHNEKYQDLLTQMRLGKIKIVKPCRECKKVFDEAFRGKQCRGCYRISHRVACKKWRLCEKEKREKEQSEKVVTPSDHI